MKILSDKLALGMPNEPLVYCPGCRCLHKFNVKKPNKSGAIWTWNEDPINPTFSPSLIVISPSTRCHSFVRDGMWEFLPDCTHKFAGQKVELPDLPKWVRD